MSALLISLLVSITKYNLHAKINSQNDIYSNIKTDKCPKFLDELFFGSFHDVSSLFQGV